MPVYLFPIFICQYLWSFLILHFFFLLTTLSTLTFFPLVFSFCLSLSFSIFFYRYQEWQDSFIICLRAHKPWQGQTFIYFFYQTNTTNGSQMSIIICVICFNMREQISIYYRSALCHDLHFH